VSEPAENQTEPPIGHRGPTGDAARPRQGVRRQLRRDTGRGAMVVLGGVAVSALASGLLARLLGVNEFGFYVFATAMLNYAVVVARAGVENSVVRFLNEYEAPSLQRSFVAWVDRGTLRSSGIVVVAGGATALLASLFGGGVQLLAVGIAALGVYPLSALQVSSAILRAERRVLWSLLPLKVGRSAVGLALALSAGAALGQFTGWIATLADVMGIAALAILLRWATRHRRSGPVVEVDAPRVEQWRATSRRMTVAEVAQQVVGQVDVILVGALFGLAEAGIFGLASRFSRLVLLGNKSANSITSPHIAKAYHQGEIATVQEVVSHTCSIAAGATFVASFALAAVPVSVYSWLGEGFAQARGVLMLLLAGQVVNSLVGPVGIFLMVTGRERWQMRVNVIAATALIGGIFAIHGLGGSVYDVAVAVAATVAGSNLAKAVTIYRETGVLCLPGPLVRFIRR
jgi:O-antigen/teichoic acid export membrane protein